MDAQRQIVSALLMVAASVTVSGRGQQSQGPACRETTVTGRVEQGQAFVATFTDDLVFRLEPETHPNDPPGWTIQIIPATDSQSDYAMVATPTYRFSNPRYVNTAYGLTAEQALSWTPREFAFIADAPTYESAKEAPAVLLWPGNYARSEVTRAETALTEVPI